MAGTSWINFVANTKARADDVNHNFDWLEGSLVPMNSGSKTNGVYDLGENTYRWHNLYLSNNFYIDGAILCKGNSYFSDVSYFYENIFLRATKKFYFDNGINTYVYEDVDDNIRFTCNNSFAFSINNTRTYCPNDFWIQATSKLFLDTGENTYLIESAADNIKIFTGGIQALQIDDAQNIIVGATKKLYMDGGLGTYIVEDVDNNIRFYSDSISALSVNNTRVYCPHDFWIPSTYKLYLDAGSDTYIHESAANNIKIFTGGIQAMQIDDAQNVILSATKKIYLDGGTNTYIHENSADNIQLYVGGAAGLDVNTTRTYSRKDLWLPSTYKIFFDSGVDTCVYEESANRIAFVCGSLPAMMIGPTKIACYLNVIPTETGGSNSLGDATYYWNEVNYKNMLDRGCLAFLDEGVEMPGGTICTDLQVFEKLKKEDQKLTSYNKPMMKYNSFPKISYRKSADDNGQEYARDSKGNPVKGADAIEMTSVFSIMMGALKEISIKLKDLDSRLKVIE
jgi:hypothetical protein